MRKTAKDKDAKILAYIKEYMNEHGYPPSYREISDSCDIGSTSTVSIIMMRLRSEGKIESEAPFRSPRAFRLKGAKYTFE